LLLLPQNFVQPPLHDTLAEQLPSGAEQEQLSAETLVGGTVTRVKQVSEKRSPEKVRRLRRDFFIMCSPCEQKFSE
jgi:hypothetical protein